MVVVGGGLVVVVVLGTVVVVVVIGGPREAVGLGAVGFVVVDPATIPAASTSDTVAAASPDDGTSWWRS